MSDSSSPQSRLQPRKRVFIGLLSGLCALVLGLAVLLWWAPSVGLANIHPVLPVVLGVVLATLSFCIVGGLLLLVATLLTGRDLFFSERLRRVVIKYLFPGIIGLGRLLGMDRDTLHQSFIALNNQLVRAKKLRVGAGQVLILLPHCIQLFDCGIKITGDVSKCTGCGRCDIKGLVEIATERGIDIAVATGGTLARKIIVDKRPRLIVAVACERDLTSGIRDAYPLPVIGILNERPHGPCFNTQIVLAQVREALDQCVVR
ncbi:DUF116 domain-containing protein [Geoalkalibacter halelectricus]|uniref:DUF116 domain-containing protein n=1 Tax=Geoalkalibacter halelectricus TaxID=2847045 RepID=A0ABY5ZHZ9_9BACT|nr:DUF116 domain-containing protein [Geoalkalibacter halelectricus]MDO3378027.1 DUF116 domain-containing protein [Geoalkalibacter halelectricus]UWZ78326.1 DUF116 domain-containing protein [Geoalkalibacter halelectricus]